MAVSKILVAVICCDFKNYSLSECLQAINEAGFTDVLLNYEGKQIEDNLSYNFLQKWQFEQLPIVPREYDQDEYYRLPRIVTARNMCINYAVVNDYDWLFFVDSDVIIPKNTKELFTSEVNYKIRSGLVPGRGVDSIHNYLSNDEDPVGDWTRCHHATCGFMAIHRTIFRKVIFKLGEAFDVNIFNNKYSIL